MDLLSSSTEQKILDAARQEFIQKGISGARMLSIAQRAGVNKALIHYYFRSKERLYEAILNDMLKKVWISIGTYLKGIKEPDDMRSLIHTFVYAHITTMRSYPDFPMMFLREFADGGKYIPDIAVGMIDSFGEIPQLLFANFKKGIQQKKIRQLDPVHIMISVLGMCVSSFLMRPIITVLYKKFSDTLFTFDDSYFNKRIETITTIVCDGILIGSKSK